MSAREAIRILVADDDADDRLLIKDAFEENKVSNPLAFVNDGEELMNYLHRRGQYEHLQNTPLPGVILLDLNTNFDDFTVLVHSLKKRIAAGVRINTTAEYSFSDSAD